MTVTVTAAGIAAAQRDAQCSLLQDGSAGAVGGGGGGAVLPALATDTVASAKALQKQQTRSKT